MENEVLKRRAFLRVVNIANSYFILIFSSLLLIAYLFIYETITGYSDNFISIAVIFLFQILVLALLPIISLLLKNPIHITPYLETCIYLVGFISLGFIAYLIFKTGGLFVSHINWALGYLLVLSLQLRVFAENEHSWRAPITTILLIFCLCFFLELQHSIYNIEQGKIDLNIKSEKTINYHLSWYQFSVALISVIYSQFAIDIVIKKKFGEKVVMGLNAAKKGHKNGN